MNSSGLPSLPGLPDLGNLFDGFTEGARVAREWMDAHLEHIAHTMEDIREGIDNLDTHEQTRLVRRTADASAGGVVTIELQGPRPGFDWHIERLTVDNEGAAAVPAVLFRGDVGRGDQVAVIADTREWVEDYGRPIYVPSGVPLVLRASAATAGSTGILVLQVVERKAHGGSAE